MSDNSTAVSPSNFTSLSNPTPYSATDHLTGAWWFYMASGLIDHVLAIPANGWSLRVILASGGRRRGLVESEIITLNLVAMEMINSLMFILWLIDSLFIRGTPVIKLLNYPYGLLISGRCLFQCLICVERYLAVVHPVVFLRYKALRYRMACCGLVWLLALGYGGIYGFFLISIYGSIIAILSVFIPLLSVDLFCSLSILRVLRRPGLGDGGKERRRREKTDEGKEREHKAGGGERGKGKEGERAAERGEERSKEEGKNQQKRRAFRMVSFMLGMLVFNCIPLIVCPPLRTVFGLQVFHENVFPVMLSFSQMGSSDGDGRLPCLTPTTRGRQQNN